MNKRNRPHRDILEDLEEQGRVPEVIMLAWGIIEMTLDGAVLQEYVLSSRDLRAKPILDLRVSDKLNLQRKLGYLSDKDYATIQKFKDKRDQLFHTDGLFFPNMTETDKQEFVDMAIAAVDVAHELSHTVSSRASPHVSHVPMDDDETELRP